MAERIQVMRPDVKILLMTGYSDSVVQSSGGNKFPVIRKPFLPEDLMRTIRSLLVQTGDAGA
jgi:two-component SAPR family response regulator